MWLRKNWFLIGLLGVIVLSLLYPRLGFVFGMGGATGKILIIIIFLITGVTLPSETILSRLANFRFHLFIQGFIFVFIPLFVALTAPLLGGLIDEWTLIGLYATAVLPTTISSNIVFTQASGGNVVASTFNAALSNVLGIFISPLLLSLLLQTTGRFMPLEELVQILRSLLLLMVVPLSIGQGARRFVHGLVNTHKQYLRKRTSVLILLIVFVTISESVATGLFNLRSGGLPIALTYLACSHLIFLIIIYAGTRLLRFSREDRISALYTGTQKTLAMGAPLLSIFFADRPELLAASIVPLSFYHMWQLIVAGFIRGGLVKER